MKKKLIVALVGTIAALIILSTISYAIDREGVTLVARLNASGVSRADAALAYGETETSAEKVLYANTASRTVVLETETVELDDDVEVAWVVRDEPHITRYTMNRGLFEYGSLTVVEVPRGTLPKALTDEGETRLENVSATKQIVADTNESIADIALEALTRGTLIMLLITVLALFIIYAATLLYSFSI